MDGAGTRWHRSVAARLLRSNRDLDAISFTESANTLQTARGKFAILYLSLQDVGRAAAPLLRLAELTPARRHPGVAT